MDGAAALDVVGDQRAGEPKLLRPINSAFAGIRSRDIKARIRNPPELYYATIQTMILAITDIEW